LRAGVFALAPLKRKSAHTGNLALAPLKRNTHTHWKSCPEKLKGTMEEELKGANPGMH